MRVDDDLRERLADTLCPVCHAQGAFVLVGLDYPAFGRVLCGASMGDVLEQARQHGHFIEWLEKPKELAKSRRRSKMRKVDSLTERCELCLRGADELTAPAKLEPHHAIEVAHGGTDDDENRRVYCTDCHSLIHWLRRTLGRSQAR